MREIKFKVWHKEDKRFIGLYGSGLHMWQNGQIYAGGMNVTDRIELLQYTGMKDKNGVEIYEGDIYKWFGHEVRDSKQIRPIRIEEVKFAPEGLYRIYCLMDGNGTVEIIGNIYEHPELLK